MYTENQLAFKVIGLALDLHKALGPGLLENVYKECLYFKIEQSGFNVSKELGIPVIYEKIKMPCGYRLDILVENKLVVEVKSQDGILDVHMAQILTYMKLGGFKLGLLINFNVPVLKQGIRRVILGSL